MQQHWGEHGEHAMQSIQGVPVGSLLVRSQSKENCIQTVRVQFVSVLMKAHTIVTSSCNKLQNLQNIMAGTNQNCMKQDIYVGYFPNVNSTSGLYKFCWLVCQASESVRNILKLHKHYIPNEALGQYEYVRGSRPWQLSGRFIRPPCSCILLQFLRSPFLKILDLNKKLAIFLNFSTPKACFFACILALYLKNFWKIAAF